MSTLRVWGSGGLTAEALHRVLVLSRPVRHSTDTMESLWLLRRVAEIELEEAFTTAFLLLTDRRWRKGRRVQPVIATAAA